jgi:hypothetical protein
MFGLNRSYLYRLVSQGKIRSVSLRERGRLHGKRLFDVQSIRHFLRSRLEDVPLNQAPAEEGPGSCCSCGSSASQNLQPSRLCRGTGEGVEK